MKVNRYQVLERWAIKNGINELSTDAEVENLGRIAVYKALGFNEVERLVCFIKKLG